ncbi:hypothetical protein GCM10010191_90710 [Actinomadura vinacea]|uniref:Uncharacterized protein n=1 Tax=Actinomadura vinacea TaxID=115336 RepID=A0ABN3KER4_9ACTN
MSARVIAFRPRRRPASVPALVTRPASSSFRDLVPAGGVRVGWDDSRNLHVARCERCAESIDTRDVGQVDEWADLHTCDPELAALLALVLGEAS